MFDKMSEIDADVIPGGDFLVCPHDIMSKVSEVTPTRHFRPSFSKRMDGDTIIYCTKL